MWSEEEGGDLWRDRCVCNQSFWSKSTRCTNACVCAVQLFVSLQTIYMSKTPFLLLRDKMVILTDQIILFFTAGISTRHTKKSNFTGLVSGCWCVRELTVTSHHARPLFMMLRTFHFHFFARKKTNETGCFFSLMSDRNVPNIGNRLLLKPGFKWEKALFFFYFIFNI